MRLKDIDKRYAGKAAFVGVQANGSDTLYPEEDYAKKSDVTAEATARQNADTTLQGNIDANTAALEMLNGTGAGSVTKTVTDKIAEVVADAPESLDTLKEISDWISGHEDDAAAMNSAIRQNAADIADEVTRATAAETALDSGKQDKTLSTPIEVDGRQQDTVEDALNAINDKRSSPVFVFENEADFEEALAKQSGEDGYIPTDSLVVLDYETEYVTADPQ